ncbi:hypothetical protein [Leyella stercorea]|uniref:hypothetical protein n=1 Tax=Leyella stercorea TaxID=363265 RepID=UPI0024313F1F|nr:hypothetical protein [Leyella stercorea]
MQNINSCHPRRSAQTSASVGADIRVGRYETEKMKICRAEDMLKDAKSGALV